MILDTSKTSLPIPFALIVIFLFAVKTTFKKYNIFALVKYKLYRITWWFTVAILHLLCFGISVTEQIISHFQPFLVTWLSCWGESEFLFFFIS